MELRTKITSSSVLFPVAMPNSHLYRKYVLLKRFIGNCFINIIYYSTLNNILSFNIVYKLYIYRHIYNLY